MCVQFIGLGWEKATQDMYAYKLVRVEDGKFLSGMKPEERLHQTDDVDGADAHYKIGSEMMDGSEQQFGFYLFEFITDARLTTGHYRDVDERELGHARSYEILKIKIPMGAVYRRSLSGDGEKCINARKIIVEGII